VRGYRFARRMSRISASAVREILKVTERPDVISFAGGMPSRELFPIEAMAKAHAEVFAEEGPEAAQYGMTEGWRPLREWIARRAHARGINADADRVLITSGSQQGIDLVAKIFLEAGDAVIVENPCYLAALQVFGGYEASLITIESDDHGMRVDQIERAMRGAAPKLIYVVSDFHNPKGTSLSRERRAALIKISKAHAIPIVEDDPYSELRYSGEPVPPLAALDERGLVISLGTFSKTISPGIRIGWAIASDEIIREMVIAKQAADLHTSTIEQRATARLLSSFDYDSHVAHLCDVYGERCRVMLDAIESHFPAECRPTRPGGGLFIWVELPEAMRDEELLEEALVEQVAFVPGSPFFAAEPRHNFIRLNFSNQPPDLIAEGIRRLGDVMKRRIA
jgi:2-aminoadipate transaminase